MSPELVSIISPVYNGEKYIGNFLDSVLGQTYPAIELILVDDGSTDQTRKVVENYRNKFDARRYKLLYLPQQENKGQAAAINVGLKIFSGTYMMWMDSDDILFPEAIEKKVGFLKNNPDMDFVLNKGMIVDYSDIDKPIGVLERKHAEVDDSLFADLLSERNVVFGPGTIMVTRDAMIKALPDLNIYESREGQNWQLMLPLAYTCKHGYLDEELFKYVVHNDSHSHMKRNYAQGIKRRDNFYTLQIETINKIVGMSEEEKAYWRKFAENRKYYKQYLIANSYHKWSESSRFKKAMGDEVKISLRERFLVRDIFAVLGRGKRAAKKIIRFICGG